MSSLSRYEPCGRPTDRRRRKKNIWANNNEIPIPIVPQRTILYGFCIDYIIAAAVNCRVIWDLRLCLSRLRSRVRLSRIYFKAWLIGLVLINLCARRTMHKLTHKSQRARFETWNENQWKRKKKTALNEIENFAEKFFETIHEIFNVNLTQPRDVRSRLERKLWLLLKKPKKSMVVEESPIKSFTFFTRTIKAKWKVLGKSTSFCFLYVFPLRVREIPRCR